MWSSARSRFPMARMIFDARHQSPRAGQRNTTSTLPEDSSYETVGGFVLNQLGFIPRGGESFEADGYRFTVMEMDHRRVSRVKIKSVQPAELRMQKQSRRRQGSRQPIPVRAQDSGACRHERKSRKPGAPPARRTFAATNESRRAARHRK